MAAKILILTFIVQGIYVDCRSAYRPCVNAIADTPALAASNAPGIAISSGSNIPPRGVSLQSKTDIDGALAVVGKLPFTSTVGLEGVVPSFGTGTVSYNCGATKEGTDLYGHKALNNVDRVIITKEGTDSYNTKCFNVGERDISITIKEGNDLRSFKALNTNAERAIPVIKEGTDLFSFRSTNQGFAPVPVTKGSNYDVNLGTSLGSKEFIVSSRSPISPTGISVSSENTFSGDVLVSGALPFLSVVSFEDTVQSVGVGNVLYRCGDDCGSIVETPLNYGKTNNAGFNNGRCNCH